MEDEYLKRATITFVLLVLAFLSFLVLKPILLSIILAIILVVIFSPIHNWLLRILNSRTLSASLICLFLFFLIVIPFWFLIPIFVQQSFQLYVVSQQIDFVTPLKTIFPSFFASDQFSNEIGSIISSFTTKTTNAFVNWLSQIILNFPKISLQILVIFFTFFFVLRDKEYFEDYLKNILPFNKDVKEKLFKSSKAVKVSSHIPLASAKEKKIAMTMVKEILKSMDFAINSKKETQRMVWQRLINKSFLTRREMYALLGFLRKVLRMAGK